MTKILAALTMLCVASIASAKDNFIDGQVFIVTGAHKSVKLGLVTVAACRPDEFASAEIGDELDYPAIIGAAGAIL